MDPILENGHKKYGNYELKNSKNGTEKVFNLKRKKFGKCLQKHGNIDNKSFQSWPKKIRIPFWKLREKSFQKLKKKSGNFIFCMEIY